MSSKATSIENAVSTWGIGINLERMNLLEKQLKENDLLLDYGCGQGAYVHALGNERKLDCTGMDLFPYPNWETPPSNCRFQTCEGSVIPEEDNHFDVSFAFEVLEHCHCPEAILKELCRVTKRVVLVSVPNCHEDETLKKYSFAPRHWIDQTHVNFWTRDSFRAFAEKENFEVLEQHSVYKLDLCRCYWESTRLPIVMQKILKRLFSPFSKTYFSSTLLVINSGDKG